MAPTAGGDSRCGAPPTRAARVVPYPGATIGSEMSRFAGESDSCLAHVAEKRMGDKERGALVSVLAIGTGLIAFLAWLSRRGS